MSKTEDALTRARRALSQIDGELDLARTRSDALTRARSRTDGRPDPASDDASASGVEILQHGQRPALPRRRAAVWALAATVALLGGAGIGTAVLWPGPGEVVPGAPAPAPGPPTTTPGTGPTLAPRECESPTANPLPTPESSTQPNDEPSPIGPCDADSPPSPSPSAGRSTDRTTGARDASS